jgi:hypothetical protein
MYALRSSRLRCRGVSIATVFAAAALAVELAVPPLSSPPHELNDARTARTTKSS